MTPASLAGNELSSVDPRVFFPLQESIGVGLLFSVHFRK